jgi:hypothetical protein
MLSGVPVPLSGSPYREVKDPSPTFHAGRWHLFGTGVRTDRFDIAHLVADDLDGPWQVLDPVDVSPIHGSCVAAPGVVAEDGVIHLFVQTTYNELGGLVEHLVSTDDGATFTHATTALTSLPGTEEAGLYDPHPFLLDDERYLAYSAFSVVGQPDVHVARSTSGTWHGPWERLGAVLRHEDVWCHNQRGSAGYEWGLEAPQVVELPDGRVLLQAVCFLPSGAPGTRQRLFVAVADELAGPYDVLGPVLSPPGGDVSGENGHGWFVREGDEMVILYQERSLARPDWSLAAARCRVADLLGVSAAREVA